MYTYLIYIHVYTHTHSYINIYIHLYIHIKSVKKHTNKIGEFKECSQLSNTIRSWAYTGLQLQLQLCKGGKAYQTSYKLISFYIFLHILKNICMCIYRRMCIRNTASYYSCDCVCVCV